MTTTVKFRYSIAIALVFCAVLSSAVDEDAAREKRCIKVPVAKNLDKKWVSLAVNVCIYLV